MSEQMNIQERQMRFYIEDGIKQEFEQTLAARVERYLKVKPHGIVPLSKFAPVSQEVSYLFRDGHFFGSISLSQSVSEAIAKFLCQRNGWKPKKKYEENILKLHTRNFISDNLKDMFLKIWENRDDYHHLNETIETDRIKIETLAYEKTLLLKKIESEVFRFEIRNGNIVPEKPKYWDIKPDGTVPVFLRLE